MLTFRTAFEHDMPLGYQTHPPQRRLLSLVDSLHKLVRMALNKTVEVTPTGTLISDIRNLVAAWLRLEPVLEPVEFGMVGICCYCHCTSSIGAQKVGQLANHLSMQRVEPICMFWLTHSRKAGCFVVSEDDTSSETNMGQPRASRESHSIVWQQGSGCAQ